MIGNRSRCSVTIQSGSLITSWLDTTRVMEYVLREINDPD